MAGAVRQPIDIPSLERYLNQNVPEIKTPLDVKQVIDIAYPSQQRNQISNKYSIYSSASDNPTRLTRSPAPTRNDMSCGRSPRGSSSPRRRTRSSVNIRSFMPWKAQMYRCPKLIAYVRIPMSLGRRSISWSSWTGACLPILRCLM